MTEKPGLHCSFCGKSQHEVEKLIAGLAAFICDECVDVSRDIIADECAKAVEAPASGGTADSAAVRMWAWDALKGWGKGSGDGFKTCDFDQRIGSAERLARWAMGGPGFRAGEPTEPAPRSDPEADAIALIDRLLRGIRSFRLKQGGTSRPATPPPAEGPKPPPPPVWEN